MTPSILALILTISIVGPLLFNNYPNGYADNGDFWRVIYQNGLYPSLKDNSDTYKFVVQHYNIMQYYNEHPTIIHSSQNLFVQIAIWINKIFYSKTIFDIRFMGLVYFIPFCGAIYFLTEALTLGKKNFTNYGISILIVFVFADSSFTLYMNSLFAEAGGYILLIIAVAMLLLYSRQRYQKRWPLLLIYFICTILFVFNKQQNAPLALSLVFISVSILLTQRLKNHRIYIISGILTILTMGVITFLLIPKEFNDINMYQSFSNGVVLYTDSDPSKQIEKEGINGQFGLTRGSAYNPKNYADINPPAEYTQQHLTKKIKTTWLIKYYLKHLNQFNRLLDLAAQDLMITQPQAVGDYTRQSGAKPYAQIKFFTGFSTLMKAIFPQKFTFLILLTFTLAFINSVAMYDDFKNKNSQNPGTIRWFMIMGLMSMAIGIPIISVIGDGDADLAKHLFYAPVAINLILVIMIADILNHQLWHFNQQREENYV
ncbi:hypothetical protein [Weissella coleopterorum]|uniref:glycan biosynthesis hexose transferase WsfD n=1 Tax=Weissella coleopterorum TaxID=2714949 RepID=UPI001FECA999|nr:hypothetical protein [Weissella coleopterorum]